MLKGGVRGVDIGQDGAARIQTAVSPALREQSNCARAAQCFPWLSSPSGGVTCQPPIARLRAAPDAPRALPFPLISALLALVKPLNKLIDMINISIGYQKQSYFVNFLCACHQFPSMGCSKSFECFFASRNCVSDILELVGVRRYLICFLVYLPFKLLFWWNWAFKFVCWPQISQLLFRKVLDLIYGWKNRNEFF